MPNGRKILIGLGLAAAVALTWALIQGNVSGQPRVQRQGGWDEGDQIASPLTASAQVQANGRHVLFALSLADGKGRRVQSVLLANGRRPAAPRVLVLGADGQEVYRGTLQYG